jgi:hypothetical protein
MKTRNYLDKLPLSNKRWKRRRDSARKRKRGNVSRWLRFKLKREKSKPPKKEPSKRRDLPNSNMRNANVKKRRSLPRKLRLKRTSKIDLTGKRRLLSKRNWRMNKRSWLRKRRRRKNCRPRQRPNSSSLRILIWVHQEVCQSLQ